ncbi:hypothetical protein D3C84_732870 [compost metagenome]
MVDGSGDLPGADVEDIRAVAQIDDADDLPGIHVDGVDAGAERHVAIDRASAVGGKVQGVVAGQIAQGTAGATVTQVGIVAGCRGEGTRRLGGMRPTDEQQEGERAGAVTVFGQVGSRCHASPSHVDQWLTGLLSTVTRHQHLR